MDRLGPSTLVEVGRKKFLFDAGRGALQRLFQLGIPFKDVDGLFLTHLHSDHIVGIPDLWLTGRIGRPWGGREEGLRVWGPPGTQEMMSHLEQAFQFDIRIRSHYYQRGGGEVVAEDFAEGVVIDRDGLKIAAFEVDHGPLVKPSFGFRIDYRGRCAVLSGDTGLNDNLIRCSAGADLLIHEVAAAEPELLRTSQQIQTIMGNHTDPQRAGEVFSRVQPKLAVFYHILLFGDVTAKDIMTLARKNYSGPMEMGEDLMTIELGGKVHIRRFTSGG
jgi:ribonuclease Z